MHHNTICFSNQKILYTSRLTIKMLHIWRSVKNKDDIFIYDIYLIGSFWFGSRFYKFFNDSKMPTTSRPYQCCHVVLKKKTLTYRRKVPKRSPFFQKQHLDVTHLSRNQAFVSQLLKLAKTFYRQRFWTFSKTNVIIPKTSLNVKLQTVEIDDSVTLSHFFLAPPFPSSPLALFSSTVLEMVLVTMCMCSAIWRRPPWYFSRLWRMWVR